MKFINILIMTIIISFSSCIGEDSDESSSSSSYYMPDIDIFIVMGPESGGTTGTERFEVPSSEDPAVFIKRIFENKDYPSVNYFFTGLGISFHHSTIRIFYVKSDPDDIELPLLHNTSSFTLTDSTGLANKGTVYNNDGPLKIYIAGDTTPGASYIGLAYVGADGILMLGNSPWVVTDDSYSRIISHELGHNFGLYHSFDHESCNTQPQGTTNRIMDYSNNMSGFDDCEAAIASTVATDRFSLERILFDSSVLPNITIYDGDWSGSVIIGTPIAFKSASAFEPEIIVD